MKKKVGIAFADFVTQEKISRRSGESYRLSEIITIVPLFLLAVLFALLILRLFYLQVLRSYYYKDLADSNRTRTKTLTAPRGVILDRDGKPLVSNSPAFKILENGKVRILTKDDALELLANGKAVENNIERQYLYGEAFAHVLGYVGQLSAEEAILPNFEKYHILDSVGKAGLEKEYESILHGQNGKELHEVDSMAKNLRPLGKQDPVAGKNLLTTLDLEVGLAVEAAMKNVKKGAVVVSDPRDGGILAIFSKPTFDTNIFTHPKEYVASGEYSTREQLLMDSENQPLLDRAISGTYPPGSTFKLITAAAALEKGEFTGDTQIEDTGVLRVGTFSFGNWYFLQHGRKDGLVDVVDAIKRSNDIYFYKAAESAGVDNISALARIFGLGEYSGIDLPGEAKGTVPSPEWKMEVLSEPWYLGDTYNYGIGQGYLLTTPLQVNTFTVFFANEGKLYKPHLLQGKEKLLKKDFIKKEYIELVRQGMKESCEVGGVAWPFFDFKVKNSHLRIDDLDYFKAASAGAEMVQVKVGCKTGTAETGGEETSPHAWITVFAPFYKPEIVVTVLVENGGEGSSVAGPIARDILKVYFENK